MIYEGDYTTSSGNYTQKNTFSRIEETRQEGPHSLEWYMLDLENFKLHLARLVKSAQWLHIWLAFGQPGHLETTVKLWFRSETTPNKLVKDVCLLRGNLFLFSRAFSSCKLVLIWCTELKSWDLHQDSMRA